MSAVHKLSEPAPMTAVADPYDEILVDLILRRAKEIVDNRRKEH